MSILKEPKAYELDLISFQKSTGTEILQAIDHVFKTESYLAGGMLRDHFFGNPGNDFDVYIEEDPGFDYESFMIPMLNGIQGFSDFDLMVNKEVEYAYDGNSIRGVYEGVYETLGETVPVQVIVLKGDPRIYIETVFCCSLSKVWKTKHLLPVYNQQFLDSVSDKIIEFDFSAFKETNYDYIEKITKRFPDFGIDAFTKSKIESRNIINSYWR